MEEEKFSKITYYSSRAWLNHPNSPSTGSVVCYDGIWPENPKSAESETSPHVYCEIADCHMKVRLHQSHQDSREDFIEKMKLLREEIDKFITHLEK